MAVRVDIGSGDDRFEDAASYLARYELYDEAFRIYAGDNSKLLVRYLCHQRFHELTTIDNT